LESLDIIQKAASKIAPGRPPTFAEVHVIKALEIIGSEKTIGRKRLSKLLGIGEGATRMANPKKHGLEQRDAAIKVGAMGATTLIFRNNRLKMPGVQEDIFERIQPIYYMLKTKLKPKENDVIIIGSANKKLLAEFGAKAAAFELLKTVKATI